MAKGTMTGSSGAGTEEFMKIWPDVQALSRLLLVTAAAHKGGDHRITAMALSLALASIMAGLSNTETMLRQGLKLNADFLEEHARSLHRDIHGPRQ